MTRKQRKQRRKACGLNVHHRTPQSRGGARMAKSIVPIVKHELWHQMFGTMTPEEIGVRITNVWIPPEYECIIRRKK